MDHQKKTTPSHPFSGGAPIARINGPRIRKLREEKSLTQLYLSEVVGVTTDTISRWENRRYPSIKLENAEKLAQALEVDLDEILERNDQAEGPSKLSETTREHSRSQRSLFSKLHIGIAVLTLVLLGILVSYLLPLRDQKFSVSAERTLPHHIPPGQSFPVLIQIKSSELSPLSLIVKEKLPPGSRAKNGTPAFSSVDQVKNTVKWIRKTEGELTVFAYVLSAPHDAADRNELAFAGSVTLKQKTGKHDIVRGGYSVIIAPYHWADTNRDNSIDDEEILAVYDLYSDVDGLQFNRDLIDDIWAGTGYYWDEKKKKYVVLEESSGIQLKE